MTASVTRTMPVPAPIPVLSISPRLNVMILSGLIEILESVCDFTQSKSIYQARNFIPTGSVWVNVTPVTEDSGKPTVVV